MTAGMAAAALHADVKKPNWTDDALAYLQLYSEAHETFLAEDVVSKAAADDMLPPPPDKRAWGAVFNAASRKGLIVNAGFRRAESSNHSFKPLWTKPS